MKGIPLIDKVRLPMKNLDKAWYVAHTRGEYAYHPPCFDWNLETLGNTDLGEPLVAPFNGLVISAHDWHGPYGKIIQILGKSVGGPVYVWAGWHLHTMLVKVGEIVTIGQDIGSIGNADGRYRGAHLHEQICEITTARGIPTPITYASDVRYNWLISRGFYCFSSGFETIKLEEFDRYFFFDGR